MNSLRVAGIDPGSNKTGYAFIEVSGRVLQPLSFGVISTSRFKELPDKIAHIHLKLGELLDTFKPEEAAVEDIFHHKNAVSAFKLGQARGAVLLTLALRNIKVFSLPPAVVKKSIAAHGAADKRQVRSMVCAVLRLDKPPPIDASDALAVAVTHARTLGLRTLQGRQ
ncbi:MAG: crossover junction endodeoxyribonuclease RuvC [Pseudomonadota bacterium]